jgi:hypothetical protein
MVWDLIASNWVMIAVLVGVLVAVAVLRPWRFWRARKQCPQCRKMLPRWGRWGWKDDWTCSQCGCQIGR